MINEKARYQEISNEDSKMFMAANDGIITYDEYYESNSVASAIEQILADKHGEEVVREEMFDVQIENGKIKNIMVASRAVISDE